MIILPRRRRVAGAWCAIALLLAGCGAAPGDRVAPSPEAPAVTVVTVPGLTSLGLGPAGISASEGSVIPAAPSAAENDGTQTATDTTPDTAAASASSLAGNGAATTISSQEISPVSSSVTTPRRPPVPPHDPGTAGSSAPPTVVAVDMTKCEGCQVIGVAAAVQPGLDAALATAPQGAVLLATRADGAVVGVANIPYGATFPAPAGKVLPCDRSGRCFVTAVQPQGNGVISAFHLAPDGQWRDVTASGGFTSAAPTALVRDVDGDGLLDIAVQAAADGALRWVVYHWSGDRFTALGCAPGSAQIPGGAALSLGGCSS